MDQYHLIEISIALFTCLFAVPIYIVFLYMLVRYRKLSQFNIPFYGLVFQCGLLDLWYVIHQYLFFNRFLVNVVPVMFLWARVQLATISFLGYFYIRACQVVAVFVISLNRFTALVTPLRHDLIWSKKLTWITIITQQLVAAMLMAPALVSGCYMDFALLDNGTEYGYGGNPDHCAPKIIGPSAIFTTFLSIVLIFLYSIMFCKARQSNVNVGIGNQTQNEQKVQRSLAIGGSIISFTLVWNTVFLLLAVYTRIQYSYIPESVKIFRHLLDTLFCAVNPFVLLCFGSKVRPYFWKCLKPILCCLKTNQVVDQANNQHQNLELANVNNCNNKNNMRNANRNVGIEQNL